MEGGRIVLFVSPPVSDNFDLDPSQMTYDDGCTYFKLQNGGKVMMTETHSVMVIPEYYDSLKSAKRRIDRYRGLGKAEYTRGEFYQTIEVFEDQRLVLLDKGKTDVDYLKSICIEKDQPQVVKIDDLDLAEDEYETDEEIEFEGSSKSVEDESEDEYFSDLPSDDSSSEMSFDDMPSHDEEEDDIQYHEMLKETPKRKSSPKVSTSESEDEESSDAEVTDSEDEDSFTIRRDMKREQKEDDDGLMSWMLKNRNGYEDSSDEEESSDEDDGLPFKEQPGNKALFISETVTHLYVTSKKQAQHILFLQREGLMPPPIKVYSCDEEYHLLMQDVDKVSPKDIKLKCGLEMIVMLNKRGYYHESPEYDIHTTKEGNYYFLNYRQIKKIDEQKDKSILLKASERAFINRLR
jgi:hypothetical protein